MEPPLDGVTADKAGYGPGRRLFFSFRRLTESLDSRYGYFKLKLPLRVGVIYGSDHR